MKFKILVFLLVFCSSKMAYSAWNPKPNWKDSFSANGFCWCDSNGYDHGLDTKTFELNGMPYLIPDICEELENHPLYRAMQDGDIPYNDIQCGNGPANDAADEAGCPGRVDIGEAGCDDIGPLWDIAWLESRPIFGGNGGVVNIALNGIATQSSLYSGGGGEPSRAIDDNTSGVWGNDSVTHTDNEPSPWWQVDLGAPYDIEEIQIFGRTDTCCAQRLSYYDVYILNCAGDVVWSNYQADFPDPSVVLDVVGTRGQFVKVQLRNDGDNEALSLAEVRVLSADPAGYCGDLTWDGQVDMQDAAELSSGWESDYIMEDLLYLANDWLTGTERFSLLFDGVDDYVEVADSSALYPGTGSWTTSFWMRSDTASQSARMVSKRANSGSYTQYTIGLSDGDSHTWPAGSKITFLFREGTGAEKGGYTTSDIDFSDWTHVAVVLDRTAGTVLVYINGVSVPVTMDYDIALPNITNSEPLYIGGNPDSQVFYEGLLDEVRLYDRALSNAEVGSIDTVSDGLVAYWDFDEGEGDKAYDSVSDHDGTIYGAQWIPE